jgi:tryptophan 2,3-dioxygenase
MSNNKRKCPEPEGMAANESRFAHADLASSRYAGMTSLGADTANSGEAGFTKPNNYWDYLRIDDLLALQTGREHRGMTHHDELMFVIVHQVFELWFKLVLFELRSVREFLYGRPSDSKDVADAVHHLRRAIKTIEVATHAFEVMDTMDPSDFLEFRDILSPASGFQSVQMRQLEIILGLSDNQRINLGGCSFREAFTTGSVDKTEAFDDEAALGSLKEGLYLYLNKCEIPKLDAFWDDYFQRKSTELESRIKELDEQAAAMSRIADAALPDDPTARRMMEAMVKKESAGLAKSQEQCRSQLAWLKAFFHGDPEDNTDETSRQTELYERLSRTQIERARKTTLFLFTHNRTDPYAAWTELLDGIINLEQAMLHWRSRHPRVVERQIGRRPGTGGSSGVAYLDATTRYRVFTDLWSIRAMVLARSKLSPLDTLN